MGRRRQNMEPFESSTPFTEANSTQHTPYINISGNTGTVVVGDGNPYHPMTASADPDEVHFITHVYVLDENDTVVTMQNLDLTGVDREDHVHSPICRDKSYRLRILQQAWPLSRPDGDIVEQGLPHLFCILPNFDGGSNDCRRRVRRCRVVFLICPLAVAVQFQQCHFCCAPVHK